ncbi:fimbrial protein [Erwinia sp. E602]|uniref:fimbrial protein n=1 Tax=Erwinia sp. E602 TaxID=2675378 RepID=UPI001BA59FEB|nr:fimbrial protein [Erwinia sp. E602]QUG77046.1 fimbrial protein [Erwinia sp. E602]
MKKIAIAALMPALVMASFSGHAAEKKVTVDGGKIKFEGSVVAAPCAVDNTTDGQTVRLGQVPANRLVAKGDASGSVPFTIKLSGCNLSSAEEPEEPVDPGKAASYTSASITFSGATAGDDTTLAVQSGEGAAGESATNVGIQIYQNNKAVKVDGSTATEAQKIVSGSNEIPFSAAYVATDKDVVAGSANAIVDFKVNYE